MALPGQPLRLSEEATKRLGGGLREIIGELDAQHSRRNQRIETWWDWYEAKPLHEQRTDPWPGASNIVVPLIRTHADAMAARFVSSVFSSDKLWIGKTQNEDVKELILPHIPDYLNWEARGNGFDPFLPLMDALNEMTVIGQSVIQLGWERRERWIFFPGRKPQRVTLSNGPVIQHVPLDQIMWQPGRTIQDSEFVIKQALLTWGDLARRGQLDGWNQRAIERVKDHPSLEVTERIRASLEKEGIDLEGPSAYNLFDIREVWIDWPVLRALNVEEEPGEQDAKTPSVPIVVTLHADSGEVLRAVPHPYAIPHWPFYEFYFKKRSGRGSSPGVAKILEHMQRGATTMLNQAIDAVTLVNSMPAKTTNPALLSRKRNPATPVLVDDMGDFEVINMSKVVIPEIALFNSLFAMSERLTGSSDPTLGRETRLGGHPAPATSTLALLQQSGIPSQAGMKIIRRQLGRLGEDIASLYQQFPTNAERIVRAMGQEDGAKVVAWLEGFTPIFGNVEFDLHALSDIHNPQAEQQKAILLDQVTANYFAKVFQTIQLVESPQTGPLTKQAAVQALTALTKSFSRVLEASDVDEIRDFTLKLRESNNDPRVISELGQSVLGTLGAAAGGVPVSGVAGPPAGVGNGAFAGAEAAGSAFGT